MKMRFAVPALMLSVAPLAAAAPPPPLPAQETAQLKNFFNALPDRIPEDLDRFAPFVSRDVKVYRQGKLAYRDREAWFAHLRSYAGRSPNEPRGISVSHESFYRTAAGGIMVLEFRYPLPPAGMEGQITYHPSNPLQMATYFLNRGTLVRVDYGPPMESYDYLLRPDKQAALPPGCPVQPEPAPLSSAAFTVPADGDALLFSAAPSLHNVRYALRVVKAPGSASAQAKLIRLKRRADCNVHDRRGQWEVRLSAAETKAIFDAAAALEPVDPNGADVVIDGTTIELQRHAKGAKVFGFASNGMPTDQLSATILRVLKAHLPASELPATPEWRSAGR